MRYLKILFLSMMVVGLIASGALAAGNIQFIGRTGAANSLTNDTYLIAYELMGNARTFNITGAANTGSIVTPAFVINQTSGLLLSSGMTLNVSFANAGFTGDTLYVCQLDSANNASTTPPLGSGAPSPNSTNGGFYITNNATAGRLMITTSSNCVNNAHVFPVRIQPMSSTGVVTASFNVAAGTSTYDSGSAANNIAKILSQYASGYSSNTSYIDYINSPANGSKFATNSVYTQSSNANVGTATVMDFPTAPTLSVSALLSLQDSASWQGVTSVYVRTTGPCGTTGGSNNVANNSPSGTVNLTIPSGVFNGANSTGAMPGFAPLYVCAQIAGNAVIQSRTIKGAFDITVSGTGANDPALDPYTTLMSWVSNGYQGLIPYLNAQSIYGTICFINNKGSVSGPVTADILSAESGASLSALSGLSLGTLTGASTMRVDFASSVTPYTYSGGTESAGTAIALTGLQSNDRYTAQINVGADPSQITVNCIQLDPAGSKRAVPVLTKPSSLGSYWQQ